MVQIIPDTEAVIIDKINNKELIMFIHIMLYVGHIILYGKICWKIGAKDCTLVYF